MNAILNPLVRDKSALLDGVSLEIVDAWFAQSKISKTGLPHSAAFMESLASSYYSDIFLLSAGKLTDSTYLFTGPNVDKYFGSEFHGVQICTTVGHAQKKAFFDLLTRVAELPGMAINDRQFCHPILEKCSLCREVLLPLASEDGAINYISGTLVILEEPHTDVPDVFRFYPTHET